MRIQHNIVAMNAYRNYTNNVSAMKKNLEKLSSGYKINRAGDDAAGLAISEKMRAQITGLQTAQKNAKDGISLVQTAEGALTEVHDMLNRMVTLATQSANGTYDNETDRVQLQKEVDQLRSEINRIADSSNFNGIKLLDGSLDGGVNVSAGKFEYTSGALTTGMIPEVGSAFKTDTILHQDSASDGGTTFSIDLHDVAYNQNNSNDFKLELGGGSANGGLTVTIDADTTNGIEWKSSDIANAIVEYINSGSATVNGTDLASKITITDASGTALTGSEGVIKLGTGGGQDFEVSVGGAGDDRIVFKQKNAPTASGEEVNGDMAVSVSNAIKQGTSTAGASYTADTANATTGQTVTIGGSVATSTIDWTATSVNSGGILNSGDNFTLTVGGTTYTVTLKDTNNAESASGIDEVEFAKGAGTNLATLYQNIMNSFKAQIAADNTANEALNANYNKIDLNFGTAPTTNFAAATVTYDSTPQIYSAGTGNPVKDSGQALHSYNWQTTDPNNVAAGAGERLASTQFKLTSDMAVDGGYVQIGNDKYTFTTDKENEGKAGYVYINDADGNFAGVNVVAQRLADAAGDNTTYTVGTAQNGVISLVEIEGQSNFKLDKPEGILNSLGFGVASKGEGKSLTLQIGESADDYNKLAVNVRDMHTASLGIGDINIGTQEGASAAIDKIKAAINMVSDVRGTLGATQNRLDHTINNLSVMTENIQDAESTIRDTDVAEEMMAYTKNNILIQSAQAMLAQANQLPQGVLQLLQ